MTNNIREIFKDKKYPIKIDQEGGNRNRLKNIKSIAEKQIASNSNIIFSVLTHKNTKDRDYILVLDQLKQAKATKISIANPPVF